jgi:hypothetical protein
VGAGAGARGEASVASQLSEYGARLRALERSVSFDLPQDGFGETADAVRDKVLALDVGVGRTVASRHRACTSHQIS